MHTSTNRGSTQDIDLLSVQASTLAQELRDYLNERFHVAVRVAERSGKAGGTASTRFRNSEIVTWSTLDQSSSCRKPD